MQRAIPVVFAIRLQVKLEKDVPIIKNMQIAGFQIINSRSRS